MKGEKRRVALLVESLAGGGAERSAGVLSGVLESLPYSEYIKSYDRAHILLDQCFAVDQGYNALEAMAKGKVVFTGAGKHFCEHYNLERNAVAIHAAPDTESIYRDLKFLIENPSKINRISENAIAFIEKHHYYLTIAQRYETAYKA